LFFEKIGWIKSKNAARRTLKEILSAPFTFVTRRLFSPFNLRAVDGKKYGRASENFKVTQTLCGSEIPPCFPAARRSQRTVKIFGTTVKTIAVLIFIITKGPSCFNRDLPQLLPPAS
jgi:hypothetical protein